MSASVVLLAVAAASAVAGTVITATRKPPKMNVAPTRVDRSGSAVADALQRRQGARANRRTGGLGAEASASSGTKTKLGT